MDKNVSGVDLEELMKAREELNQERGVETDPNMYKDYNPNRNTESENSEQEKGGETSSEKEVDETAIEELSTDEVSSQSKEPEKSEEEPQNNYDNITESNTEEAPVEKETEDVKESGASENLNKYDIFSAFEVDNNVTKNDNSSATENRVIEEKPVEEKPVEEKPAEEVATEKSSLDVDQPDNELPETDDIEELEKMIGDILSELDDESSETAETKDESNNENDESNVEKKEEVEAETEEQSSQELEDAFDKVSGDLFAENTKTEEREELVEDAEKKEEDNILSGEFGSNNEDIFSVNDLMEELSNDSEKQEEERLEIPEQETKPKVEEPKVAPVVLENEKPNETEIITDYNQLKDLLQKELEETEAAENEKLDETDEQKDIPTFEQIEEFRFLTEIAGDEFKSSDKLSYLLGKNEKGEIVYGNFKVHYNLAVFGKNEEITDQFLNSMMLSLCLKNSVNEVNFIIFDPDINSVFEVYNKSSYLFFNRVVKTYKEMADALIEVSKEIDERYEKLASLGCKNIEQFNEIATETNTTQMPYVVLIVNNYTKISQATESEKINSLLYQILKYGRLVGINSVVVAKLPITISQINYNLSSRIGFKSDEDSRYTVGQEGAEYLPDDTDALYFNIAAEDCEHVKIGTISDTEVELIIGDLED